MPKQKPLQAIILDLDLNGKVLRRMPFVPSILTARLVEHVEEHGESIVKPDLTGHCKARSHWAPVNLEITDNIQRFTTVYQGGFTETILNC